MNLSYSYASRISPVNGTGEFNLKSDSSTDVTSSIRSDYLFNTAQEEPLERVANRQLRQTISYQARTRLLDMFSDSDTSKTQETYQQVKSLPSQKAQTYLALSKKQQASPWVPNVYTNFKSNSGWASSTSEYKPSKFCFEGSVFEEAERATKKMNNNKILIDELRKRAANKEQEIGKLKAKETTINLSSNYELSKAAFKKKNNDLMAQQFYSPQSCRAQPPSAISSPIKMESFEEKSKQPPIQPPTCSSYKEIKLSFRTPSNYGQTRYNADPNSPRFLYSSLRTKPSESNLRARDRERKMEGLQQFVEGKKLGEGKFGSVSMVRHKITGGIFALKKIPKAVIKSNLMVDQLALQIRLQSCLNHENILAMYGFFDDTVNFYIVLEYMEHGTLYEQLKKGKKLTENETVSIVKQVTSAMDYLHDMGIAHRDLKPENIVIANNVYKLCDFGWATFCDQRRKTYCGTFDYVAPQILEGEEYDHTVDLWCIGVMTYELLTGKAPFYHLSRKETMKKILNVENSSITYPQYMSRNAVDFIDKLIKKNPLQRMTAANAMKHPFLASAE